MTGIARTKRVFLDSCILKRLARGEWPAEGRTLRTGIDRGDFVLVVTNDHIADYGDCTAEGPAMREALYVDTLHPLWVACGDAVYHREAYSEYLRLTGGSPLPPPCPLSSPSEALLQWVGECGYPKDLQVTVADLAARDRDVTFSGKLRGGFQGDLLGLPPGLSTRLQTRTEYADHRRRARQQSLSGSEWDRQFRMRWVRWLTDAPAKPPDADLHCLSAQVDFSRMPAWMAMIGVERTWYRSQTQSRPSDLTDMRHLALLPYVDVFVAEKNLVGVIEQAKVAGETFVYADIRDWLSSTLRPQC